MKHPNRKAEAQNKWQCEFHQQIRKSRKNIVNSMVDFLEAFMEMKEKELAEKRRGGKTIPVDINTL